MSNFPHLSVGLGELQKSCRTEMAELFSGGVLHIDNDMGSLKDHHLALMSQTVVDEVKYGTVHAEINKTYSMSLYFACFLYDLIVCD